MQTLSMPARSTTPSAFGAVARLISSPNAALSFQRGPARTRGDLEEILPLFPHDNALFTGVDGMA